MCRMFGVAQQQLSALAARQRRQSVAELKWRRSSCKRIMLLLGSGPLHMDLDDIYL